MISLDLPQQVWLRGLMSHLIVSEKQAKAMHKSASQRCRVPYDERDYDTTFSAVQKAVGSVGLELRRMVDEVTGTHMMAIVNMRSDDMAQMATSFTSLEIEYIKLLVGDIFTAPNHAYCVTSTRAVNLGSKTKPELASSKAEAVCKRLVRQGWLRVHHGGFYSLSSRSLLELQGYLRGAYEEYLHKCGVCKDIVTHGQTCLTQGCETFIHDHCRLSYESGLTTKGDVKLCSDCKMPWTPVKVGDTAKAANRLSARRRARPSQAEEDEEDELVDEGESSRDTANNRQRSSSTAEPSTNKKRRISGRSTTIDDDATQPLAESEAEVPSDDYETA